MLLTSTIAKPIRSCIFPLRSYFLGLRKIPLIQKESKQKENIMIKIWQKYELGMRVRERNKGLQISDFEI